eukprot:CAMPEP_0117437114 /NCGR_PEP_ID=MMETSP0759-20121206/1355_1 /TAXON_ID=63605 /ORGANISM="Percolomonas cosmopolitus, Strain WS" /LENGTH=341 /DNA_ID=CAMNT_0005228733 /DNA_START=641 /DNA_END=1663 /DNA_ORIENTATION=-
MGSHTSKRLPIESITYDSNTCYHIDCPFARSILKTPYFREFLVTSLNTFIIEKDAFLGVLTPNDMHTMLLFRKTYTSSRNSLQVRCVKYRRKIERWPFQGIFFPIGEIGLGVMDQKSGSLIHGLRTGCLQSGQVIKVFVLKNAGPARLLAAAQTQHWASVSDSNPAIVDMFEDLRERDRADQIESASFSGSLKVLYLDSGFQYVRRGPRGPVGPEQVEFEQGCEVRVASLVNRDIFMWLILETSDRKIFQSRQIRVYSEMFFRNKFGLHASEDLAEAEKVLVEVEKEDDTSNSMDPALKDIKKVSANREPTKDALQEDSKVDALRGNPSTAEKVEESQKVS